MRNVEGKCKRNIEGNRVVMGFVGGKRFKGNCLACCEGKSLGLIDSLVLIWVAELSYTELSHVENEYFAYTRSL